MSIKVMIIDAQAQLPRQGICPTSSRAPETISFCWAVATASAMVSMYCGAS
jgi:hypothetical protein